MAWFEWRSSKEKKSAIKNIVAMMKADGKVTEAELACLQEIAKRVDLSEEELQAIVRSPDSTRFVVPRKRLEKVRQLVDVSAMMVADGEVGEEESVVFFQLARSFGFSQELAEEMHRVIVSSLLNGEPLDHVCDKVETLLDFP